MSGRGLNDQQSQHYLAAMNVDESNKVVLVGDFGVGKSTIFTRFKTGGVKDVIVNTRKECEFRKTLTVDGKEISMILYDTAGMERFEGTIPPTYFRSAKVVIFVYSITNEESISSIVSWAESVSPQRLEFVGNMGRIIRVLVGNKVDLEEEREVTKRRGEETANNYEMGEMGEDLFFEISALEGTGFDEMFETIARHIRKEGGQDRQNTATLSLPNPQNTSGSGSGCACK